MRYSIRRSVSAMMGAVCALAGAICPLLPIRAQSGAASEALPRVTVARTPDGGIQPQAAVDARGVLHLIYFKGDPAHGDLFYVYRDLRADAPFSAPIRVNSRPHSAVALGTIRGAQIARGKDGRVLVVWNGSDQASAEGIGGAPPMLYTRSNADESGFEPERNLIAGTEIIDGGGAIAADARSGAVYVLWHAVTKGGNEANGGVYEARSVDGGATFAPATRIATANVGTCGCCGMRAAVDASGGLYVLFRAATQGVDRDTMQLTSRDGGATFAQSRLQPWRADVCPMSLFGMTPAVRGTGMMGAWETQGSIYFATLAKGAGQDASAMRPLKAAASERGVQKYPVVAVAGDGTKLVAWVEGAGWNRGGTLAWRLFDAEGRPVVAPESTLSATSVNRVPVWSLPAAVSRPDGGFLILY